MPALWKRVKKLDHYSRAVLVGLPVSTALLLGLIISHASELWLSDWVVEFVVAPAFIGNFISGSTYIGTLLDSNTAPAKQTIGKTERALTIVGAVVGLGLGIVLSFLKQISFVKELKSVAHGLFYLNHVGAFTGLGRRVGVCLDSQNTRPQREKRTMAVAATVGLIGGALLAAFKVTAWVSIAGVTSFFTGGAILPILGAAIFACSFSSSLTSFADYASKAFSFHEYTNKTASKEIKETIKNRYHEYQGSRLGVVGGLVLGIAVATALVIGHQIVLGVAGIVASAIVVTTCISVLGGLCARVGRFIDTFNRTKEKNLPQTTVERPRSQSTDAAIANALDEHKSAPRFIPIKRNEVPVAMATHSAPSLRNHSTFKARPLQIVADAAIHKAQTLSRSL